MSEVNTAFPVKCEHTRLVEIGQLVPHPQNCKNHDKDAVERQAAVMEYQGWRRPITVSNLSGRVTSGHKRLLAAKLKKATHVPVSFQDYDNEDQEIADLIADNALNEWEPTSRTAVNLVVPHLGPDFDINMLGLKDFTLDIGEKDAGCDEDETPETPPEPVVKRGELWILGEHRLLIDDCTVKENVERLMAGEKAELCFTSPPYSDQRDYNGASDLSPFTLAKCMLAPADIFVINLGYQRKNGEVFRYWDDWIHSAATQGLKLLSWNIWDRSYAASIGQQTAMFPIEHEWIFVFGKDAVELNRTIENKYAGQEIARSSNREADGTITKSRVRIAHSHRPLGTILRCDIHKGESPHPAMFPVSFPEAYINAIPCERVYEPFCGSGSTLIACEKTGRKCFGMEIDPHYGQVIIERWQKFSGKKAHREDGILFDELKPTTD